MSSQLRMLTWRGLMLVNWQRVVGPPAKDIGVGSWDTVWIVRGKGHSDSYEDRVGDGFVYYRSGQGWTIAQRPMVESRATRIAVAPNGEAWVIASFRGATAVHRYGAVLNASVPGSPGSPPLQVRAVYYPYPLPPTSYTGSPIDIGVGAVDTAHAITPPDLNRSSLVAWDGYRWGSVENDREPQAVAVEPNGTPWIVRKDGRVLRFDGDDWTLVGSVFASDIGVGAGGRAWVVAGGDVFSWSGAAWERADSFDRIIIASAIAVSPEGTPWIVDQNGLIYRGLIPTL